MLRIFQHKYAAEKSYAGLSNDKNGGEKTHGPMCVNREKRQVIT